MLCQELHLLDKLFLFNNVRGDRHAVKADPF